ncbi:TetR/AcrR family transcriptional regulator [Streptomyces benahoarensis]|uniref:TetR/AcrR family transcriptional regulator n=1 Tax=Streptomyces benahoarensis TaxID=2595054 RepID=A0A553YSQ9_9ACTN|nr:TetR/AcrR family transcriptional regulator [Streptomyces benahoarensis]TSB18768.1 TetR/AcrR family transcriptional regulator [Streptomyces benahoarensis]TSB32255.1 TetR/AcrR family transcriptional regulator [Streptomyces benahoarensis]
MAAAGEGAGMRPKSVWLGGRPPLKRKADQPDGLDLDKIVAATVRLLDADGLAKFSMRRLAAELGVTAMSVYWYVDTKDDLLELAIDAVAGEMRLPDEDGGADWRDQLRVLATAYRDMLLRHPWVARLLGEYLNIGPRSLAFSNATLRVMGRSGLEPERASGALAAVFHFVYGFATIRALHEARCRAAGVSLDDYFAQVTAAMADRPEYAETRELSARAGYAREGQGIVEMLDREFAFALDLQIAGIETLRDRATGG